MAVVLVVVGLYLVLWVIGRVGEAAGELASRPLRRATRALQDADRRAGASDRFPRAAAAMAVLMLVLTILTFALSSAGYGLVVLLLAVLLTANVYIGGDLDENAFVAIRRLWATFRAGTLFSTDPRPGSRSPFPGPAPHPTPVADPRPYPDPLVLEQSARPQQPAQVEPAPSWALGADVTAEPAAGPGSLVVRSVHQDSPADQVGLVPGDVLLSINGQRLTAAAELRAAIAAHRPVDEMRLEVRRGNETIQGVIPPSVIDLSAEEMVPQQAAPPTGSVSTSQPWGLGIKTGAGTIAGTGGLLVHRVTAGSPAERAGLRRGDVLLSIDGREMTGSAALRAALATRRPGVGVTLGWRRGGDTLSGYAPDNDAPATLPVPQIRLEKPAPSQRTEPSWPVQPLTD